MTYRNALKNFIAWTFIAYCFVVLAYPAYGQGGCRELGRWEDGSIVVACGDAVWAFDPDGQPFENAAGVPVREPGWYLTDYAVEDFQR
jgi:hypothetical protein